MWKSIFCSQVCMIHKKDITGLTTDFLNDTCVNVTQEQLRTKPVLECSGLNASIVTVTLSGNNLACMSKTCVKDSTLVIATVAKEVDEPYRRRCGLICDVEYPVYCEVMSSSGPGSCSFQCDCTPRKCGRWLALLGRGWFEHGKHIDICDVRIT